MEDLSTFIDMPSPSSSLQYMYPDSEQYLDPSASETHSSVNSPYDMSSIPDLNSLTGAYPSAESEEESTQASHEQKPATKRKRENRYKNAPPSVLSRRRAQNRASQRAYRERKDQRIKDLEQMLNESKQRNDMLGQAYQSLVIEYNQLRAMQFRDQNHAPTDLAYHPGNMNSTTAGGSDQRFDLDMYVYSDLNNGYAL